LDRRGLRANLERDEVPTMLVIGVEECDSVA
jgi:hypothetical protein